MAEKTRKYHVQHFDTDGRVVRERIVEATSQATARAYASNTTIAVELLSTDAALRLGNTLPVEKGVVVKAKVLHPEQQELFTAPAPVASAATRHDDNHGVFQHHGD